MRIATLLYGISVACTQLFGATRAKRVAEGWTFANGVVRNCEAIPRRATVNGGTLNFLAATICDEPKV